MPGGSSVNIDEIHQAHTAWAEDAARGGIPAAIHYLIRNEPVWSGASSRDYAVRFLAERIAYGTGGTFGGGISVGGEFTPLTDPALHGEVYTLVQELIERGPAE
jgi:hypothetical protein